MGGVRKLKIENVNYNDVMQESMYNFFYKSEGRGREWKCGAKVFPTICN
jgi:hypothetical protein